MQSVQKDIRNGALYQQAEALYRAMRHPGSGLICEAAEISTNGSQAVFSGTLVEELHGEPATRICLADLASAEVRVLTFGPRHDRLPKFSADGTQIAFLSDRHKAGDFQLYLLDPVSGAARAAARVEGWVEYLHWSPDGKKILLGVAGHGADVAGGQGAVSSKAVDQGTPSWMPRVEAGDEGHHWRRAWVYELATHLACEASPAGLNIWEAVWCGNSALAAVVSPGAGEGLWYGARLHIVPLGGDPSREVYVPKDQIGWPAASPSGEHLAIVEAVCSDRGLVAGDLRLIDTQSGEIHQIDTLGVDITCTEWRSERRLLVAGHRGLETVVELFDLTSRKVAQVWSSSELTTAGRYCTVAGSNDSGDCALVGESFTRAPEIAVIRQGTYRSVRCFDAGFDAVSRAAVKVEQVNWKAADGLQIQGWLLRPHGSGPYPVVMNVHGGPVSHWRPTWLGRYRSVPFLMLVQRGYAVFMPNPRGSSGRGQDFVRHVYGDLGGADARDLLSGLDMLVDSAVADPKRLGVSGVSYGGFMTSWLITQDSRFVAAVPVCPHTNQVTQHLLSNIPHFMALFLDDSYANLNGKYFQRSPVLHAHKAKTPTLNVCGALDRCTPPEEATQFHNALLENGVRSALVTYPEEGHGIRRFPAVIDYAARVVAWFEAHMPATGGR